MASRFLDFIYIHLSVLIRNVGILRLGRNAISGASVFIQVVTESFFFSHPLSALHSLIVVCSLFTFPYLLCFFSY
ncbi:hypothetical protein H4Q26_010858 [Puccinia striiformis f. sp. tritici PST-130]|nr:hypothetical protein H4Q26_010858 [Puccinia striiformis f. sp. tritici PST-130]